MKFSFTKKTALAAAVAGVVGLAPLQSAHAGALASSLLDITDFTFFISGTNTPLDSSDFVGITPASDADASASLGGTTESYTEGPIGGAGTIDFPLTGTGTPIGNDLCVGACPGLGANNTFPVISSPPGTQFSAADQLQEGSPISGLGAPVGARAVHEGVVSLTDAGVGSAGVENGLQSGFVFTVAGATAIDISFNARTFLEAFTNPAAIFPTAANAAYNFSVTIDDLDNNLTIVDWEPDGAINSGGASAIGVTETADPFDLNDQVSRSAPFNGSTTTGLQVGAFFGTTVALLPNVTYQLTIQSDGSANATKVPAPGALALLGIGLAGLGFARKRKTS